MNKDEILKAAQKAHVDEGQRSDGLKRHSYSFLLLTAGLLFLLIVRATRNEPNSDLMLLAALAALGAQIHGFKHYFVLSLITSAILLCGIGYAGWLVLMEK